MLWKKTHCSGPMLQLFLLPVDMVTQCYLKLIWSLNAENAAKNSNPSQKKKYKLFYQTCRRQSSIMILAVQYKTDHFVIFIDDSNCVWFRAKDVAKILGYIKTHNSYIHIHSVNQCKKFNTIFINENGLLQMIVRSYRTETLHFCNWVVNELLPHIKSQYFV